MTEAQERARDLPSIDGHQFDHPYMIRARRMWAELIARGGQLAEGDTELLMYFHVPAIRDRLMADVIDPYAWDEPYYSSLFMGAATPTDGMVARMKAATRACQNLTEFGGGEKDDWVPLLMISSMIQWLVGNTNLAITGTQIALKLDPEYELAGMMLQIFVRGIQPRWMTADNTTGGNA